MSLKQQILQGTRRTDTVYVAELVSDEFDGNVTIRPLTDGEQDDVAEASVAGQTYRGKAGEKRPENVEIDVATSQKGQARAKRLKVAYGLSVDGDKWSEKDVSQLPPQAVVKLSVAIDRLTRPEGGDGSDDGGQEAVERFRDDS